MRACVISSVTFFLFFLKDLFLFSLPWGDSTKPGEWKRVWRQDGGVWHAYLRPWCCCTHRNAMLLFVLKAYIIFLKQKHFSGSDAFSWLIHSEYTNTPSTFSSAPFHIPGFFLLICMLAQICRFVSSSHGCSPTINSLRMTTMPNIDFQQVYIVRVCVKCSAKSLPHSVCVCAMLLCHAKVLANTELWQICAARWLN